MMLGGKVIGNIPPRLLAELVRLRPVLELNGAVVSRRDGSHRLRVRVVGAHGRPVHRSVAVGGEKTAAAVKQLIDSWRVERRKQDERRRAEARRRREAVRRVKRAIIGAFGGGSHRRRRIAREIDEAARSPDGLARYLMSGAHLLPNPKPGRKRRAALV